MKTRAYTFHGGTFCAVISQHIHTLLRAVTAERARPRLATILMRKRDTHIYDSLDDKPSRDNQSNAGCHHDNNKKERASRQLNIFMVISTGGGRGGKRGAKGDAS